MITTIKIVPNVTVIKVNGAMPVTQAQIEAYLLALPQYESDEAATADDITIYRASNANYTNGAHESAAPGTLIIIET